MYSTISYRSSLKETSALLSRLAESSKLDGKAQSSISDPVMRAQFAAAYAKAMRNMSNTHKESVEEDTAEVEDILNRSDKAGKVPKRSGMWLVIAAVTTVIAGVGIAVTR